MIRGLKLLSFIFLFLGRIASAEGGAGIMAAGRGGPYVEYHLGGLSSFDSSLAGNPLVIGGVGFGFFSKTIRIGGGGGGGFLWTPSGNVHFGLGYGGVIGEYALTHYLSARLMIGGGGYSVGKSVSETDTTTVLQKLASGGFILFYPSITAEVALQSAIKLGISVGYFLPNVSKLQTMTIGVTLLFGKV